MKDELNGILADLSGQKKEKVESDTERDFFMSAEDAREYGLIDAVFSRKPLIGGTP
jgi:ATP-dependent Clp protease protease subunit